MADAILVAVFVGSSGLALWGYLRSVRMAHTSFVIRSNDQAWMLQNFGDTPIHVKWK